jgi:hypothetical protein
VSEIREDFFTLSLSLARVFVIFFNYFFGGAWFPFPFGNRVGEEDFFAFCCDFAALLFAFAVRDILMPDQTPVPCMESVAPTA